MQKKRLRRAALLCALCLASAWFARQKIAGARAQTRIDAGGGQLRLYLPASGEMRVENYRGAVALEIWGEDYVAVSAGVDAAQPAAKGRRTKSSGKSPVRVERNESLLSVSVARATPQSSGRVDLKIFLPGAARAKVFTSDGEIVARGLPASLSAQTVSGDIKLDLPAPPDADVTAHSLNGSVIFSDSRDASRPREVLRQKLQARLGVGSRAARLFSGRGRIRVGALAPADDAASVPSSSSRQQAEEAQARSSRPPTLGSVAQTTASNTASPPPSLADTPQEVGEDEVVRVESDLVTVNFSVVNRETNRGVIGLAREDFKLFEDGVEQQVEHFEASGAPFDLMLLIDLSGSTAKVTDLIRAAATRFVNAARSQDRISILAFAGDVKVVAPLTTDRDALRAAISAMQRPDGDTRIYDAVNSAMEFFEREAGTSRRRAVILMSDGLDSTMPNVTGTGSTLAFDELRSRVEEFDGILYSIWTSTYYEAFSPLDIQAETFDLARDRTAGLAEAGGGIFYDVERLEDLAGAYERVIEDLGTVYSLSYRPTNRARDGRWRTIRIRLPRHPQTVARGKRGYRAN